MTVYELKKNLDEIGVSDDLYSIMIGGFPNDKLCLVKEETWQVYYSERGKKVGEKFFEREEDACAYFFEKLKRYSTNISKEQHDVKNH